LYVLYQMVTLLMTFGDPNTQTTLITTFCIHFHIFVVGELRDFKFDVQVNHSKLQPVDYKLFLKGAWSQSGDLFKFKEIISNLLEMVQDRDIVTMED